MTQQVTYKGNSYTIGQTVYYLEDVADYEGDYDEYACYGLPLWNILEAKVIDGTSSGKYIILSRLYGPRMVFEEELFHTSQQAIEHLEERITESINEELKEYNKKVELITKNLEDVKAYYAGFKVLP